MGQGFKPQKLKKLNSFSFLKNALTGIRTPVLALKGLRPSPLDDEGELTKAILSFPCRAVKADF